MPMLYQAIDDADGTTLPDGIIVAQSVSEAVLRTQLTALGRTEGDYTVVNQRIRIIDTSDAANWNRRCVPGWYRIGPAVHRSIPMSDDQQAAADRKAALRGFLNFRAAQMEQLDLLAYLSTYAKHQSGHEWLYWALVMLFLVDEDRLTDLGGSNAGSLVDFSVNANVVAFANALSTGAAGITTAAEFYDDPAENNAPSFPVSWRDLTDVTFPALSLTDARRTRNRVTFSGTLPTTVELNTWVTGLLAPT